MESYIVHRDDLYRWVYFILLAAIFLLFNHQYEHFVVKYYSYMGFKSNGVSWTSWLIGGFAFLLSSIHFISLRSGFLFSTSVLIQLFFLIPNLIVWMHTGENDFIIILIIFLLLILNWEKLDIPSLKTIKLPLQEQSILLIILAGLMLLPLLSAFSFHFDASIFTFGKELYEIRRENTQLSNPLVGYVFSPYVKVLLPLIIGFGFVNKQKWLSLAGVVLMLTVFLLSPHKSIFVGAIVVFGFAILSSYQNQLGVILGGVLILSVIGAVLGDGGSLMLNSLLVRRVFFLPAYLNSCYLELFQNDTLYYSYGFMRHFFDYPYELEPSFLIGQEYFNSSNTNANNGILSDFIINLGHIGAFVGVLIVGLMFKFIDSLKIHAKYFGLFFLLLFTLLSSGFIVVLVTHGGIFLLVLSFFFLSNTQKVST